MNKPIVLTIIAQDQPGIVNQVSSILKHHGGNWTQSSMSHLAGQFAGILLAHLPDDTRDACLVELHALDDQGILVSAQAGQVDAVLPESSDYILEVVGNDRPGIVADITSVLAEHGVSVHGLKTRVEAASMAGGELFRANARLMVPNASDPDALTAELEDMASDLMVEIGPDV